MSEIVSGFDDVGGSLRYGYGCAQACTAYPVDQLYRQLPSVLDTTYNGHRTRLDSTPKATPQEHRLLLRIRRDLVTMANGILSRLITLQ